MAATTLVSSACSCAGGVAWRWNVFALAYLWVRLACSVRVRSKACAPVISVCRPLSLWHASMLDPQGDASFIPDMKTLCANGLALRRVRLCMAANAYAYAAPPSFMRRANPSITPLFSKRWWYILELVGFTAMAVTVGNDASWLPLMNAAHPDVTVSVSVAFAGMVGFAVAVGAESTSIAVHLPPDLRRLPCRARVRLCRWTDA